MKVDLVYPDLGRAVDGIGDYAECLTSAMRESPRVEPTLVRVRTGREACGEMLRRRSTDAVLIQYMPYSWGRWGFAPWLVLTVAALRVTRPRTLVGIMVHECYEEIVDTRSAVMGTWQRLQLRLLLRLSHARGASIGLFADQLEAAWPHLPVECIPASSPFIAALGRRDTERRRHGWTEQDIVLCTMLNDHRSKLAGHVGIAANAVAAALGRCTLVVLGAEAGAPENLDDRVAIIRPGFLPAGEIGPLIAACDVYLAPYLDGVSSRRTSLLAGLQQGVAVVGTKGPSTNAEFLHNPGIRLTDVNDAAAFGMAAVAVAADPQMRVGMASRMSRLFDERYSYAVVARQWIEQLNASMRLG